MPGTAGFEPATHKQMAKSVCPDLTTPQMFGFGLLKALPTELRSYLVSEQIFRPAPTMDNALTQKLPFEVRVGVLPL